MKKIFAFGVAVVFSFFLFGLMSSLIDQEAHAIDSEPPVPIDIISVPKDTPVEVITRRPPKKPPELKPVKKLTKTVRESKPEKATPMKVAFSTGGIKGFKASFKPGLVGDAMGVGSAVNGDGGLAPKVRVEPSYPMKAAADNIEGYVTLSFDVNPHGDPVNIKVVEAKPKGYFEKSARKALRKWKYTPEKKDGAAVSTFNQSVTLEFKLAGE
ncbi:energy transducer TonB [Aliikangiella coralliicola]|nr:energy transducer TonB [Aliikangiella coralliicola]